MLAMDLELDIDHGEYQIVTSDGRSLTIDEAKDIWLGHDKFVFNRPMIQLAIFDWDIEATILWYAENEAIFDFIKGR